MLGNQINLKVQQLNTIKKCSVADGDPGPTFIKLL